MQLQLFSHHVARGSCFLWWIAANIINNQHGVSTSAGFLGWELDVRQAPLAKEENKGLLQERATKP